MKCSEFKENVAAFALDALSEAERRACEAHLGTSGPHEGCEEELRRAYETTALLGAALPGDTPGEHVWAAIESQLGPAAGEEGAVPADSPATERPPSRSKGASAERPGGVTRIEEASRFRAREGVAWTLAIAAAVAGLALLNTWRADQSRITDLERQLAAAERARVGVEERFASAREDLEVKIRNTDEGWQACLDDLQNAKLSIGEYDRALRLMGAPKTLLIQLAAQGDVPYRASALLNGDAGEAMLVSSELAPQEGKDYQLWLIRGDQKISAGLLDAEVGATLAQIDPALLREGAPDAIAVTIEPTGGMPQPTGPIVLLGKVGV